jgi:hypothetical protein
LKDESDEGYQLNERLSGCDYDLCENLTPRRARFERVISSQDSQILRTREYDCEAQNARTLGWRCYGPLVSGNVTKSNNGWFLLSKIVGSTTSPVDDETILDIFNYASSTCLLEQTKKLATGGIPGYWKENSFHFRISRITSTSEGYQVDFPAPFRDVIIDIRRRPSPAECKFELIQVGGRVY